jgi:hypothetical protein
VRVKQGPEPIDRAQLVCDIQADWLCEDVVALAASLKRAGPAGRFALAELYALPWCADGLQPFRPSRGKRTEEEWREYELATEALDNEVIALLKSL